MDAFSKLLNDKHDPRTVEKLMRKIGRLLAVGEEVECIAVQKNMFFNDFPDYIALTCKRIIFCRFQDFGLALELKDYPWAAVLAAQLTENLFGAKLTVETAHETVQVSMLPKKAARELYRLVQAKKQEGQPAGAPHGSNPQSTGPAAEKSSDDTCVHMLQLQKMLEYRLINQNEYDERRNAMLSMC